jgi:hypothetical protein
MKHIRQHVAQKKGKQDRYNNYKMKAVCKQDCRKTYFGKHYLILQFVTTKLSFDWHEAQYICLIGLISTKDSRWVWPVSRWCLLLRFTRSYLCICRGSVLLYTRFCNCLLGYNCVLHIVNFAILYFSSRELKAQVRFSDQNLSVVCRSRRCRKLFTFSSSPPELLG